MYICNKGGTSDAAPEVGRVYAVGAALDYRWQ